MNKNLWSFKSLAIGALFIVMRLWGCVGNGYHGVVFWDVMPCGMVGGYQCFRGTGCLSLFSDMLVIIYEITQHRISENCGYNEL